MARIIEINNSPSIEIKKNCFENIFMASCKEKIWKNIMVDYGFKKTRFPTEEEKREVEEQCKEEGLMFDIRIKKYNARLFFATEKGKKFLKHHNSKTGKFFYEELGI